jgi:hypothetical protein
MTRILLRGNLNHISKMICTVSRTHKTETTLPLDGRDGRSRVWWGFKKNRARITFWPPPHNSRVNRISRVNRREAVGQLVMWKTRTKDHPSLVHSRMIYPVRIGHFREQPLPLNLTPVAPYGPHEALVASSYIAPVSLCVSVCTCVSATL